MECVVYDIIYADPPWQFRNYSDETATKWVGDEYELLSLEKVKALPINSIASEDSALFLWVTMPQLHNAFGVMEAWGFTYKTCAFTWVKQNKGGLGIFTGMGYYTRSNAELCLLGTKGKPLSRLSHSVQQVIITPRREHSQKPSETRERIVELFGDRPRIELFAREKVDGWDAWGNEINSDIILEA